MPKGRASPLPLWGHSTAEAAILAALELGAWGSAALADELGWPPVAVRNALYRLRGKHRVSRSPYNNAWAINPH